MDLGELNQEALEQGMGRSTRFQRDETGREVDGNAGEHAIVDISTKIAVDRSQGVSLAARVTSFMLAGMSGSLSNSRVASQALDHSVNSHLCPYFALACSSRR